MKTKSTKKFMRNKMIGLPGLVLSAILGLTGCDRTETDWHAARLANTEAAYNDFLARHPQSPHMDEVKKAIEELDWKEAKAGNAVDLYKAYLLKNGQGRYVAEAKDKIAAIHWQEATATNTVEGFERYVKLHGEGEHVVEAKDKIAAIRWQEATATNTVEGFERYVQLYGESEHVAEAKDKIAAIHWQEATATNTVQGFERYVQLHAQSLESQRIKIVTAKVKISRQFTVTGFGFGGRPGTMKSNGIGLDVAEHPELSSTMSAEEAGRLGLIKCEKVGTSDDGSNLLMVWLKESSNARLAIYNTDNNNWKIIAAEFPEEASLGPQQGNGILMSGEKPNQPKN